MKALKVKSIAALFMAYVCCIAMPSYARSADVDYLGLAALLISDGNYNRAEAVFKQLEQPNKEGEFPKINYAQYHLLKGLLAFKLGNYTEAEAQYELSIEQGQQDKMIYIHMAQVQYALENYQQALMAIEQSQDIGSAMASVHSLKAECYWKLKRYSETWSTLGSAQVKFPQETRYQRQKIYYLIEKGLYQSAIVEATDYLENKVANPNSQQDSSIKEYIALGRALRESGQLNLAAQILEKAKLLYPESIPVMTELAHVYVSEDQLLSASDLFSQANILEPKLSADTAELYRQAGRLYRALNINSEVNEQSAKMKQRLAILVELGDFESVAAMDTALDRLGLYENQDILYAHAYSLYRTGDFPTARTQLSRLTRPDLFKKATELRSAMEKCEGATWQCF